MRNSWDVLWADDNGYLLSMGLLSLRIALAPGMLGTFSPPPRVSDPDMHYGTCVTHVPWYIQGSLTSGFLWNRWREIRSRHSRLMHNPQFCVFGKRPMRLYLLDDNELQSALCSSDNFSSAIWYVDNLLIEVKDRSFSTKARKGIQTIVRSSLYWNKAITILTWLCGF